MKRITLLCSTLILGALVLPALAQQASPGGAMAATASGANANTSAMGTANARTNTAAPTGPAANSAPGMENGMSNGMENGNAAPGQSANQNTNSAAAMTHDNAAAPTGQMANRMAPSSAQTAMNGNGTDQMSANVNAVPDNRHKYSPGRRAADNRSEAQTTQKLNQAQAGMNAGANAPSQ